MQKMSSGCCHRRHLEDEEISVSKRAQILPSYGGRTWKHSANLRSQNCFQGCVPLKPRLLSPSLSEERSFFSWRPVTLYDKTHTQEQTTPIRVFLQLMQFLQCGATRFPLLYDLSRLLCDNPDTSWARPRMEERKYRSAQDVKNTSKFCGCTCTPCTKSWRIWRKNSNESD